MTTVRIQPSFAITVRDYAKSVGGNSRDQQAVNALYEVAEDKTIGTKYLYIQKRFGSVTQASVGHSVHAARHYSNKFFPAQMLYTSSAFLGLSGGTTSTFGTLTAPVNARSNHYLCDAQVGDKGILGFVTEDSSGWFIYSDSFTTNYPSFLGSVSSGTTIVSSIANTVGIYTGQALTLAGIFPAGTRVSSVPSSTQIGITEAATSTSTTAIITKEALSKIIDPDFPPANSMEAMNGRFYAGTLGAKIYQSALNDPSAWNSTEFVTADYVGDGLLTIFKLNNYIIACGVNGSLQYYYDAGNPTGSVLSANKDLNRIGVSPVHSPLIHETGVYFIGSNFPVQARGNKLYRFNGINSFEAISDDVMTGLISDAEYSLISDIRPPFSGKSLIALHAQTSSTTFPVYDPSTGKTSLFTLHSGMVSGSGEFFTLGGISSVYSWAVNNTFLDSNSSYTARFQFGPWDAGTEKWKIVNSLRALFDTETSGTVDISWSDDDGNNYSTPRSVDLSVMDKRLTRCGRTQRRMFRIDVSTTRLARMSGVEIDYTLGK